MGNLGFSLSWKGEKGDSTAQDGVWGSPKEHGFMVEAAASAVRQPGEVFQKRWNIRQAAGVSRQHNLSLKKKRFGDFVF